MCRHMDAELALGHGLALCGDRLELLLDPYTGSQEGLVKMVVSRIADVKCRDPKAFVNLVQKRNHLHYYHTHRHLKSENVFM